MPIKPHDSVKWGVHVSGPDSILAAPSFEKAVKLCHGVNEDIISSQFVSTEFSPLIFANVIIWPDDVEHSPDMTDWEEIC